MKLIKESVKDKETISRRCKMRPIAKINCQYNGVYYDKGDEIEVKNKEDLVILNQKGFIEPLTPKQIQNYFKKEE